ncbi:hypothetical protein B0H11DRAFT_2132684 [Mycena galericulata]|nr:hypothetical protein B0H11DRAFT_2132684 [Mycena galericulata]
MENRQHHGRRRYLPLWSYLLGLAGRWMPMDLHTSVGTCAVLGVDSTLCNKTFRVQVLAITSFGTWLPTTIANLAD